MCRGALNHRRYYIHNTVAGIPAGSILSQGLVNFTRTFDADIDMTLHAPNGQIMELSTDNGGGN